MIFTISVIPSIVAYAGRQYDERMMPLMMATIALALEPTKADLTYKVVQGLELKLDLYLPEKTGAPLVVWVHGGGWQDGGKANPPAAEYLVSRGFAYASIRYRLSGEAKWPAQIEDCEDALRWLRERSAEFGYDARKVGAWGLSAGGHLVAMLGTRSKGAGRADVVVDYFGPTDFLRMNDRKGRIDHDAPGSPESKLLGAAIQTVPELVKTASPPAFVSKGSAPMLIVHGDKDPLVPIEQSGLLRDALKQAGVVHEYVVIEGGGHGGAGFFTPEMLTKVAGWFEKLRF